MEASGAFTMLRADLSRLAGTARVARATGGLAPGIDALLWLATADAPGGSRGRYSHDRQAIAPSHAAQHDRAARRLWDVSEALVSGY